MPLPVRAPSSLPATTKDLLDAFASFLRLDVANGDASDDTIRAYHSQVQQWVDWCLANDIDPAVACETDVKRYRQALVSTGYKATSIAHKLTVLRRFYRAAQEAGFRRDSPAAGVRPPRDKRPVDDVKHLDAVDLALLLRAVPKDGTEKNLRDRAMLALFSLQGLRTVELHRASFEDIENRGNSTVLIVRGKGRDRIAYLRPDVTGALNDYLSARSEVIGDKLGTPLFAAVGNRAGGRRISRRGIRLVVDGYLKAIEVKRAGMSCHALRHTCATLAYKHSRDLRAVQDLLGHASPTTTSRYAHIVDKEENNVAGAIPVKIK